MIRTVLGNIGAEELGITLPHEHICCYSDYAYAMAEKGYLDKEGLINIASQYLAVLKKKYGLNTFVDCTPINIGRDIELLKRVSEQSEVNIIASTGFYFTDEVVLHKTPCERLAEYIVTDAKKINAGIIKCAVENEALGDFDEKLLRASAMAHRLTGLPIVLHTNGKNKNAPSALRVLISEGVTPGAITVGHLSDSDDTGYLKQIASYGCFIGLDRMYRKIDDEYISKKVESIEELVRDGYENKILLSHDALFFNGFDEDPRIDTEPRFSYCFDYILPKLSRDMVEMLTVKNPMRMLDFY